MKLRAITDGFIRVQTPRGMRSRRIEAGQEFTLPDGDPVPAWAEDPKAPKRGQRERPQTSHDPKPTKGIPPSGMEPKAQAKAQTSTDGHNESNHDTI